MLEIYNEDIRDLLSRKKDDSKKHQVRPPPGSLYPTALNPHACSACRTRRIVHLRAPRQERPFDAAHTVPLRANLLSRPFYPSIAPPPLSSGLSHVCR